LNRLSEVGNGSVPLALMKVGNPAAVVGRGIFRGDLDGPVEVVDCLGILLAVDRGHPTLGGDICRTAIEKVKPQWHRRKQNHNRYPAP